MRVYIDSRINTFFIEGVSSGPVTDFAVSNDNDLVSIYRPSLTVYDIYRLSYTLLQDQNGNYFPSVGSCIQYLTRLTVYQGALTAVYPLNLDPNNNYLTLDQLYVTDGGNW